MDEFETFACLRAKSKEWMGVWIPGTSEGEIVRL